MLHHPLRPAEILTIAFCALLFMITLAFRDHVPESGTLLYLYASLAVFQFLLPALSRAGAFLSATRDIIFPVVCILVVFDSLSLLIHGVNPQDIDHILIRLDYLLTGAYPTIEIERFMHPAVTDVLQISYTTYYVLPVILGITLLRQGRKEEFERVLFMILLCFYLSYIGYLFFPALGPRFAMAHVHQSEIPGSPVSFAIRDFLNFMEGIKRDAFPSGHTGISLTVLYLAWKYERSVYRIFFFPVVLLLISTVYCRYHYIADIAGGIVLAVVTITFGELYYKFRINEPEKSSLCSP